MKIKKGGKYSMMILALEQPARELIGDGSTATVTDLLRWAPLYGVIVPNEHQARSALGQVFRRIGAVNVGTEPARRASAKGVRQVLWAYPSPYRDG
jgi:hypothetical protein